MQYPKRCPDIGFRLEFSFLPQTLYRSGANGNEECSFTNPVRGPFPVSRRDVVPVSIGDAPISHLLVPGATASLHASWSLTVPFLKRAEHPGSAEILRSRSLPEKMDPCSFLHRDGRRTFLPFTVSSR